ncbi:hypothetical protein TWF694_008235 [Orbilia ellipsospora]|uniref:tyrosinase n=1 Tax=Orbilia ellipsospora TaxID=2528407 RepID=A0AAV9XGV3_9PEZI
MPRMSTSGLMKGVALVLSLSSAIEPVFALPVESSEEVDLFKRAAAYSIVGATNGCVNRQRIDVMQSQQPDTFNLFLLAFQKLYTTSSSDPWSWYGLAGIHGVPWQPWPNPNATGNFAIASGYCPHGSVLFGPWHRPYMLAVEQQLVAAGLSIANTFTGSLKTKYVNAAKLLRFPYWDWAAANTQSHLPPICMQPNVTVVTPTGSKTIANPLFSYHFKTGENQLFGFFPPYSDVDVTVRAASSQSVLVDNEAGADLTMENDFQTRRSQLYSTLMMTGSYNDFSGSLEGIHNQVHTDVGGNGGHMTWLPYSAFDPIFWLHHCNVDRLLAIWQAANPGFSVTPGPGVQTFARPSPTQDDITTPLYPFIHSNGLNWTSQDVSSASSIWKYNYGFPEVPCSYSSASSSQLDAYATSQINTLYQPTVASVKRDVGQSGIAWNFNAVVDQSELPGGFSVSFFIGKVPTDPAQWSSKRIGSMAILGGPGMTRMSNIVSATIPLNQALDYIVNESTEDIENYLAANLVWGCTTNDGEVVDVSKLTTLKVGVTSNSVTYPADISQKPSYGTPKLHVKATQGKKGGVMSSGELKNPKKKDGTSGTAPMRFSQIQS